jgi:hypothetical protein
MNRTGIYISRLFLAGLFLVFNVGLPILVNSCPMPKAAGSMMCPFCHEYDGGGDVVIKGRPCCSPSIAAERNTNEFLSVKKLPGFHPAAPCTAIYSVPLAVSFSVVPGASRQCQSQVPPDDIPVLNSSLLI